MDFRRFRQVCEFGWKDAIALSGEDGAKKGKWSIFFDILYCFLKFNVWSNQYRKEKLHLFSGEQKKEICLKYKAKNTKRDQWVKEFFDNYKFLRKWSSFKYEASATLQAKRRAAYQKQYGLGENCFVGYDVKFHKHHYVDSKMITGSNCGFSEHVDIDYTGGIQMGDNVWFSEGAKVFTHNHVFDYSGKDEGKGCILTPLVIHNKVWIGARAVIMAGVNEIGRGALISACSFVRSKVPPYAVLMGNPAKIVGFRMPPKQIVELEKELYPESERIPLEVLEHNYIKYFINRIKDIKEFVKQ